MFSRGKCVHVGIYTLLVERKISRLGLQCQEGIRSLFQRCPRDDDYPIEAIVCPLLSPTSSADANLGRERKNGARAFSYHLN